jgi:O-acetyl-ADP-ribose deacetylase (regulator of RNase III)
MKIINGDLLNVKEGIICHQVNTYGIMGAGLALSLKNKFPNVYKQYNEHCRINKCDERTLHGSVLYVYATNKLIVANVFSQLSFETDLSRRTDLSLI